MATDQKNPPGAGSGASTAEEVERTERQPGAKGRKDEKGAPSPEPGETGTGAEAPPNNSVPRPRT
jgi:hypothetical protein